MILMINQEALRGITLLCLLLFSSQVFAAADYTREQPWADEILPGVIVGQPIYLTQQNQHQFLGLYATAENSQTALLIVHGWDFTLSGV